LAHSSPVELVAAKRTRWAVTAIFVVQIVLFGVFYFVRTDEQHEDCREQRAVRIDAEQNDIAFLEDMVEATTTAGRSVSDESRAIVDDIEARIHRRYAALPEPSACT
jgi:hypothetical protein